MTPERFSKIKDVLKNFDLIFGEVNGTLCAIIPKEEIIEVCEMLKFDEELSFDMLLDAVSIDRFNKKDRFEMVYNLYSNKFKDRMFIRIHLDTKEPEMHTLSVVWKSANWYEREAYDMMGIKFINHPDLRRVYMPEEYEHHPLRKDFPLMGIPGSISLPNK